MIESARVCVVILYRLVRAKVDNVLIGSVGGIPCSTTTMFCCYIGG